MAGLGQDIRVDGEVYKEEMTVPANTTAYTDILENGTGGQNASINVKGVVETKVVLQANKTLTVKMQDSNTETDEDFKDIFTVKTISSPVDEAYSIPVGTVIFNGVIPVDVKKNTRLSLTTNDAGAVGKVDIFPQYLPR
jgi:hypothetical protein